MEVDETPLVKPTKKKTIAKDTKSKSNMENESKEKDKRKEKEKEKEKKQKKKDKVEEREKQLKKKKNKMEQDSDDERVNKEEGEYSDTNSHQDDSENDDSNSNKTISSQISPPVKQVSSNSSPVKHQLSDKAQGKLPAAQVETSDTKKSSSTAKRPHKKQKKGEEVLIHLDEDTGLDPEVLERKMVVKAATISSAIKIDPIFIEYPGGWQEIREQDASHVDRLVKSIHDNPSDVQALTYLVLKTLIDSKNLTEKELYKQIIKNHPGVIGGTHNTLARAKLVKMYPASGDIYWPLCFIVNPIPEEYLVTKAQLHNTNGDTRKESNSFAQKALTFRKFYETYKCQVNGWTPKAKEMALLAVGACKEQKHSYNEFFMLVHKPVEIWNVLQALITGQFQKCKTPKLNTSKWDLGTDDSTSTTSEQPKEEREDSTGPSAMSKRKTTKSAQDSAKPYANQRFYRLVGKLPAEFTGPILQRIVSGLITPEQSMTQLSTVEVLLKIRESVADFLGLSFSDAVCKYQSLLADTALVNFMDAFSATNSMPMSLREYLTKIQAKKNKPHKLQKSIGKFDEEFVCDGASVKLYSASCFDIQDNIMKQKSYALVFVDPDRTTLEEEYVDILQLVVECNAAVDYLTVLVMPLQKLHKVDQLVCDSSIKIAKQACGVLHLRNTDGKAPPSFDHNCLGILYVWRGQAVKSATKDPCLVSNTLFYDCVVPHPSTLLRSLIKQPVCPSQLPRDFCRSLVARFSKEGDTVLELFGGGAEFSRAAFLAQRNAIVFEHSEETNRALVRSFYALLERKKNGIVDLLEDYLDEEEVKEKRDTPVAKKPKIDTASTPPKPASTPNITSTLKYTPSPLPSVTPAPNVPPLPSITPDPNLPPLPPVTSNPNLSPLPLPAPSNSVSSLPLPAPNNSPLSTSTSISHTSVTTTPTPSSPISTALPSHFNSPSSTQPVSSDSNAESGSNLSSGSNEGDDIKIPSTFSNGDSSGKSDKEREKLLQEVEDDDENPYNRTFEPSSTIPSEQGVCSQCEVEAPLFYFDLSYDGDDTQSGFFCGAICAEDRWNGL